MFGPKKKTTRRYKKKNSMVPVLFTIGIIGWGFFAIDRLTAPLQSGDEIITQSANYSRKHTKERDSWKVTLEKWIKTFESKQTKAKPDTPEISVNNINTNNNEKELEVIADTQLNKIMNRALKESGNNESRDKEINSKDLSDENPKDRNSQSNLYSKYKLYFYSNDGKGNLYLKVISVNSSAQPEKVFRDVIAGPGKYKEKHNDLIESFPVKPRVLNASLEADTVVLNFDQNFGMGVSFETLKLQINQLWLTARQFPGAKSLKILINGKENQTIGSDGYNIPRVINESSWLIAEQAQ